MIQIEGLYKSYYLKGEAVPVLKNIDLTIKQGEYVALMGTSGSGKSTLLNIIGLLDNFQEGKLYLNDKDCSKLSETKKASLRNKWLGFVFQSFQLVASKTAMENVALPMFYQGISRKESYKRAKEALGSVGLADRINHYPGELSGGQKQRVAIARALVTNPPLILADEPTGALDSDTSEEVMAIFKEIHQQGKTILMVTHDPVIAQNCERTILMKDGIVVTKDATKPNTSTVNL